VLDMLDEFCPAVLTFIILAQKYPLKCLIPLHTTTFSNSKTSAQAAQPPGHQARMSWTLIVTVTVTAIANEMFKTKDPHLDPPSPLVQVTFY
jgi:hypothetical protein